MIVLEIERNGEICDEFLSQKLRNEDKVVVEEKKEDIQVLEPNVEVWNLRIWRWAYFSSFKLSLGKEKKIFFIFYFILFFFILLKFFLDGSKEREIEQLRKTVATLMSKISEQESIISGLRNEKLSTCDYCSFGLDVQEKVEFGGLYFHSKCLDSYKAVDDKVLEKNDEGIDNNSTQNNSLRIRNERKQSEGNLKLTNFFSRPRKNESEEELFRVKGSEDFRVDHVVGLKDTEVKTNLCPNCEESFSSKESLRKHLEEGCSKNLVRIRAEKSDALVSKTKSIESEKDVTFRVKSSDNYTMLDRIKVIPNLFVGIRDDSSKAKVNEVKVEEVPLKAAKVIEKEQTKEQGKEQSVSLFSKLKDISHLFGENKEEKSKDDKSKSNDMEIETESLRKSKGAAKSLTETTDALRISLNEREEKLNTVSNQTSKMESNTHSMLEKARELNAKKSSKTSWW